MAREKSRSTDQAGTGPDPRLSRHLMPLREARRFRLARGEPDIRGWSVFTSSGQQVGRVGDLLVDTSMGEVVMFDVNRGDTGDQTIAPLRSAWIDRDSKRVIIDAAYLAPAAPQTDVYTTTTTMRSPVPPSPAAPTGEEPLSEIERDGRDIERGERVVRSEEIDLDRRLADSDDPLLPADEALPPRDVRGIDRREYDDHPERPA